MADKKLGILDSEIILPSITIALPITVSKKVERAEMSDGSGRYAFFKEYKGWEITFPAITKTELDALILLRSHDQILRWQNNDESADWYDVVIIDFSYDSIDPISATKYYRASMTLEEAV